MPLNILWTFINLAEFLSFLLPKFNFLNQSSRNSFVTFIKEGRSSGSGCLNYFRNANLGSNFSRTLCYNVSVGFFSLTDLWMLYYQGKEWQTAYAKKIPWISKQIGKI